MRQQINAANPGKVDLVQDRVVRLSGEVLVLQILCCNNQTKLLGKLVVVSCLHHFAARHAEATKRQTV